MSRHTAATRRNGAYRFSKQPKAFAKPNMRLAKAVDKSLQALERRQLLAASVYVGENAASDFLITNDTAPAGLSTGDTVTWNPSGAQHPQGTVGNLTFGTDAFTTVNDGIAAADVGGTVYVEAGTYSANTVLNKRLTLSGAKFGVDARGRVAGSPNASVETVLTAASGTVLSLATGSAGSVINGFAINGGTRGLDSASGPLDGLQVRNNDFRGSTDSKMFLNDSGVDITVNQNSFDGTGQASGALVHLDQDNFNGFRFFDNWVRNRSGGTGFFVDGNHNVGPSVTRTPAIVGNLFDANQTGANLGRFAFGSLATPNAGTISGNTFSNSGFDGLQGGMQNTLIAQNTFSGNGRSGLALTGFGGAGDATRGAQNNFVSQNVFVGNVAEDMLFSSGQFPGTIATNRAFGNSLASAIAVTYAGTETINTSGNWWNTASNPETAGRIGGAGANNVDYTPWLQFGTDTDAGTAGFQGDFSHLNVDDDSAQAGSATRIQEAVDALADGSLTAGARIVDLAAGTYADAVNLNKSLQLLGEQVGVDARGRVATESIITSNAALNNGALLTVTAPDFTVDGLTLDGDNTLIAGGVTVIGSGADSNARRGMRVLGVANVVFRNNRALNLYGRGVQYEDSAPTVISTGTITRNVFDNIGPADQSDGFAALVFDSTPNFTDNDVTDTTYGANYQAIYNGNTQIDITGNNISTTGVGIVLNETGGTTGLINVSNNTVTLGSGGLGVQLWSVAHTAGAQFNNNTFTGTGGAGSTGVYGWTGTGAMDVTFSGGSISGFETGVLVSNDETFGPFGPAASSSNVTLNNVALSYATGGTGVSVLDTNGGASNQSASVTLSGGTTIAGDASGIGVLLSGGLARMGGDSLGNTAFTGFTGGRFVALTNGAYAGDEIDGTGATYNGVAGGASLTDTDGWTIEDQIMHGVDLPGVGLVRTKLGNVYLTPNSFASPTTTSPSIQRAIDVAASGDRVAIQAGNYTDNVTVAKAITLDGQGSGPAQLVNWTPSNNTPMLRITSTNGTDNVTIADIAFNGTNTAGEGIRAEAPASFDTVSVARSSFANFSFDAILVVGDTTNGISAQNIELSDSTFTNNGGSGGGGTGDISVFTYNGDASFTNLTLTGNAGTNTGEQIGIQFRGVGTGAGVGVQPMGDVSFNNIDISGSYVRSFIGIQRYSDVSALSMTDVKLGGATSAITGTFGAAMRIDASGTGSVNSPAALDLGNTHFRGLSNTSPQPTLIEFAPDNAFAFIHAIGLNTIWDLPSAPNTSASALTTAQAYDVYDRMLDYTKNLPANGSFKGWVELQNGKAFVTPITAGPITGNSISRAAQVVDSGGTIHIKPGTYTENVDTSSNDVTLSPGNSPGQVTINGNLTLDANDALDIEIAGSNPATQYDNFIVNGTVTLGGADLNVISTLVSPTGPFTIISNDSNDPVNGQFAQGSNVTVNSVPFNINYAGGDGNDVVLTIAAADPVYVNDNWVITTDNGPAGFSLGDQVSNTGAGDDGSVTNRTYGVDAFDTVQGGVNGVAAGGEVRVLAGTYIEDVAITVASTNVIGFGAGTKTVSGAIGGSGATFAIQASDVEVAGLSITREGNNTTDWNNPALNSTGIAIQGLTITNALIRDNSFFGNRTGIDINNSGGHTVRNNTIDNNRTGMIFRNQTDNMVVTENFVTDNWTVGILFLDASGGTNSPVQQALNSTFTNNNLSGNWYGQIVDRQSGGSLPTPGTTNLKDFSGNWFGTTTPVITTANSTEPGYAGQIPVEFGGTATPPGGQPDIAGPASANFDITPLLESGTDTNVETTPGRGTGGFQGSHAAVLVTSQGAQTGTAGRIQEGHDVVDAGGTVDIAGGSYADNITVSKAVSFDGEGTGPALVTWTTAASGGRLANITSTNATDDIAFRDIVFHGINNTLVAGEGIRTDAPASFDALTVERSSFTGFASNAISVNGDATNGVSARNVVLTTLSFATNGSGGGGGSGDVSLFQYNGDATFTDLTLVGTATASTGQRNGIQFRGVGAANGAGVLPMGTIVLNDIDISGNFRTSMLGLQRYSDTDISFTDVKLGGASSNITGTFGASLRIDAVGAGTVASPATIDFGNTHFRGLSGSSAQRHELEFAPDNGHTFLRADATDTTWTIGGVDTAASALTLSEAFAVERRILHYVDKLHPTHFAFGGYRGFAEVQTGKAFVTDDADAGIIGDGSIERGSNAVPSNTGEVHVEAGTYNQLATITNPGVKLLGAQAGVDARTRAAVPESVLANTGGSLSVQANGVRVDGFTIRDANALPLGTGLYLAPGFSGYQVVNNIITNNTFGMYLNSGGATQTVVQHNLFASNNQGGASSGNGIYADQGSKNILVDENKFTGHTSAAMVFSGALGTQDNITVTENEMVNDNSIAFFNTTNLTISNNTSTGSLGSAIFLGGGNMNVLIASNSATASPTISGIRLANPADFGMTANSNVQIVNNTMDGLLNGINASTGSMSTSLLIQGNTLSNNTNGARITGIVANIAAGNDIFGNTNAGLLIETGANVNVTNGAAPAIRNNFIGIDVNGGTANITGITLDNNTTAIRVMGGGNATLTSDTFNGNNVGLVVQNGTATITTPHKIDGIAVGNAGLVTVNAGGSNLIVTTSLTITGSGKLDLNDNDMIVDYSGASTRAAIQGYINSARGVGAWTGNGLTSTAAKNRVPQNTTLGVMEATEYKSIYGPAATFGGETIDNTAVLIKYTYYGDADFNGVVNFDDYSRTDAGFNFNRTGWVNGDYDGNGVVNFDDYSLIDLAFNTQSGTLRPGASSQPGAGKTGKRGAGGSAQS